MVLKISTAPSNCRGLSNYEDRYNRDNPDIPRADNQDFLSECQFDMSTSMSFNSSVLAQFVLTLLYCPFLPREKVISGKIAFQPSFLFPCYHCEIFGLCVLRSADLPDLFLYINTISAASHQLGVRQNTRS
jgi:hypothetical protein